VTSSAHIILSRAGCGFARGCPRQTGASSSVGRACLGSDEGMGEPPGAHGAHLIEVLRTVRENPRYQPKLRCAAATPVDLIDFRQTGASANRIRLAGCGVAHGQPVTRSQAGAFVPERVRLFGVGPLSTAMIVTVASCALPASAPHRCNCLIGHLCLRGQAISGRIRTFMNADMREISQSLRRGMTAQ